MMAAAAALPPGGVRKAASKSGGAIGAAMAGKGDASSQFDLPARYIVGLSDRRLLICSTGMTDSPKALLFAIPLGDVRSAAWEDAGRLSQIAAFSLRDGRVLRVEVNKRFKGNLDDLMAKIQPLLAA